MVYNAMDKRPLRALSFVLGINWRVAYSWHLSRFAAKTSELEIWQSLPMWAVCEDMIHGVGLPSFVLYIAAGASAWSLRDIVLVVGLTPSFE